MGWSPPSKPPEAEIPGRGPRSPDAGRPAWVVRDRRRRRAPKNHAKETSHPLLPKIGCYMSPSGVRSLVPVTYRSRLEWERATVRLPKLRNHPRAALTAFSVMTVTAMSACGASNDIPRDAVAKVGNVALKRSDVAHWMASFLREDYFETLKSLPPAGILARGPDYTSCVTTLEAVVARPGAKRRGRGALKAYCAQLERAVRLQAVGYLVLGQWMRGQAAERGVTVSAGEVRQRFNRLRAESFPTEAELHSYLSRRGRSFADEMIEVRHELISGRLLASFATSGGFAAYDRFTNRAKHKWTNLTTCRAGYVVAQCGEYTARDAPGPSASVVIKAIAELSPPVARKHGPGRDLICKNAHTVSGYRCRSVPIGAK